MNCLFFLILLISTSQAAINPKIGAYYYQLHIVDNFEYADLNENTHQKLNFINRVLNIQYSSRSIANNEFGFGWSSNLDSSQTESEILKKISQIIIDQKIDITKFEKRNKNQWIFYYKDGQKINIDLISCADLICDIHIALTHPTEKISEFSEFIRFVYSENQLTQIQFLIFENQKKNQSQKQKIQFSYDLYLNLTSVTKTSKNDTKPKNEKIIYDTDQDRVIQVSQFDGCINNISYISKRNRKLSFASSLLDCPKITP